MSNVNEPARPAPTRKDLELTKRETIAMHALQGILACYGTSTEEDFIAEKAVKYTDSLLKELEK